MKLQLAEDSSLAFEATVRIGNNVRLQEFQQTSAADGTMQCYVPVENGQSISMVCKVSNMLKRSVIDFTVDGILRNTYTHNTETTRNFSHEFATGIFAHRKSLRRGTLTVNSKRQHCFDSNGTAAVGTLEVRLYRQELGSVHKCKRASASPLEVGHYRELDFPWDCFGVLPDTELVINSDELLTQSKRTSYKTKFNAERPGSGPFAVMRFVYRLKESLQEAGIMPEDARLSLPVYSDGLVMPSPSLQSGPLSGTNTEEATNQETAGEQDNDKKVAVQERKRKRARSEDDGVDDVLYGGQLHTDGTGSNYMFDDWGNPVKATAEEMAKLEEEIDSLRNMAKNSAKKAEASRKKLTQRARTLTAEQRRWIELQKTKELFMAEIARWNKEDEVNQAKLNRQED